jgi:hypothetical protein
MHYLFHALGIAQLFILVSSVWATDIHLRYAKHLKIQETKDSYVVTMGGHSSEVSKKQKKALSFYIQSAPFAHAFELLEADERIASVESQQFMDWQHEKNRQLPAKSFIQAREWLLRDVEKNAALIQEEILIPQHLKKKITFFVDLSHLEEHPLGRLEWLYLYGILVGKVEQAKILIETKKAKYEKWIKKEKSGCVILGSFYKGHWSAPGIKGLTAKMWSDGGMIYGAGLPGERNHYQLNMEEAYKVFKNCTIWFLPEEVDSKKDYFLKNFQLKSWSDKTLLTVKNARSYWARSPWYPEEFLQDIVSLSDEKEQGEGVWIKKQ